MMKVVALAGGVGGAKMADGLARALSHANLTVIVNTGDDFEHFGLKICPDLDTVCYTLAGIANPETGWGIADETWHVLERVSMLGGPTWFKLGDRDLGTHLERTRLLQEGYTLSAVTDRFCRAWRVGVKVLPMSDDPVSTWVETTNGELAFQTYFVEHQCQPTVRGFRFEGVEAAKPAPGIHKALAEADLVVICPSNPWVSIDPILAVQDIRSLLATKPVIAVSPIVGGRALKGPAAKMYRELGITPSANAIAAHYGSLLKGIVLDEIDKDQAGDMQTRGLSALVVDTVMISPDDRERLAHELILFAERNLIT